MVAESRDLFVEFGNWNRVIAVDTLLDRDVDVRGCAVTAVLCEALAAAYLYATLRPAARHRQPPQ